MRTIEEVQKDFNDLGYKGRLINCLGILHQEHSNGVTYYIIFEDYGADAYYLDKDMNHCAYILSPVLLGLMTEFYEICRAEN